jgi:phage-related minor tail protein
MADRTLQDAAQDFAALGETVSATAAGIENTVNRSFTAVAGTIARAAESGRLSMRSLTQSILSDFERIAARDFIAKPIESLIGAVAESLLPVAGARAIGGPVMAGQSYLVGERGPELFTPAGNGAVTAHAALTPTRPNVTVNIATPDANSFFRSKSQVAALLAKAVGQGQRNL